MNKTNFYVDWENNRVFLGERLFYMSEDGPQTILENLITKEKALLRKYIEPFPELLDRKKAIITSLYEKTFPDGVSTEETDREIQLMDDLGRNSVCKHIIYPYDYFQEEGPNGSFYTVTELPEEDFFEKYITLEKIITEDTLPLYHKILAALNLVELLTQVQSYFGISLQSLQPEDIYVKQETGEVYLMIERWLSASKGKAYEPGFGFPPEWNREACADTADDKVISYFLAFAVFRLLCGDDPFDGSETLVEFPCLTKEAIRSIHDGSHKFIFAQRKNGACAYIGQAAAMRWRKLPAFLRRQFMKAFTEGIEYPHTRISSGEWLKTIRQLRDCVVFVNNQFRMCDPEVSNKVLFLRMNEYLIPIWNKKAIYWYHAEIDVARTQNGIVAGINAEGYLVNCSQESFTVTMQDKAFVLGSGEIIKPEIGMEITFSGNVRAQVVSGENGLEWNGNA